MYHKLQGNTVEPQNLGSCRSPRPRPLSAGSDFMMIFVKPKLCIKSEVASFSRCRNIKGRKNVVFKWNLNEPGKNARPLSEYNQYFNNV